MVIIDMISSWDFVEAEKLLPHAAAISARIARLKARARAAGVPIIYANDNAGRWRSDFPSLIKECIAAGGAGARIAEQLRPDEEDYFVLKPKQSAFFSTPLELLLRHLKADRLLLTGGGERPVHSGDGNGSGDEGPGCGGPEGLRCFPNAAAQSPGPSATGRFPQDTDDCMDIFAVDVREGVRPRTPLQEARPIAEIAQGCARVMDAAYNGPLTEGHLLGDEERVCGERDPVKSTSSPPLL